MVRVPVYESQQKSAPAITQTVQVDAPISAFGGVEAKALEKGGDSLEKFGSAVAQREAEILEENEKINVISAMSALDSDVQGTFYDPQAGILSAQGKDAIGAAKRARETLAALQKQYGDTIQSDYGKALFAQQFATRSRTLLKSAAQHETGQRQKFITGELEAAATNLANEAAMNPAMVSEARARLLQNAETLGSIRGMGEQAKTAYLTKNLSSLHKGAASTLARTNPAAAEAYLRENASELTPQDIAGVERGIRGIRREQRALAQQAEKAAAEREDMIIVQDAIDGEGQLDPFSREDQKRLDTYTTRQGLSVQDQIEVTRRTGLIPASLRRALNGGITNAKPSDQVAYSQGLAALLNERPTLITEVPEPVRERALVLDYYTQAGVKPEDAVMRLDDTKRPKNDELQARRKAQLGSAETKKTLSFESIEGEFQPWFSDNPAIREGIKADYDKYVRSRFIDSPDLPEDVVRDLGVQYLKGRYTTTNLGGGPRLTDAATAPERVYAAPLRDIDNSAWQQESLKTFLGTLIDNKEKADYVAGKARVVYDEANSRGKDRPVYAIQYIDQTGDIVFLQNAQGERIPFAPRWEDSPEYKRRKAQGLPVSAKDEDAAAIAESRSERERRLQNREENRRNAVITPGVD